MCDLGKKTYICLVGDACRIQHQFPFVVFDNCVELSSIARCINEDAFPIRQVGLRERVCTPRYWVRTPQRAFVHTIALSKLVAFYLDRELVKDQTLSDWSLKLNKEQLRCTCLLLLVINKSKSSHKMLAMMQKLGVSCMKSLDYTHASQRYHQWSSNSVFLNGKLGLSDFKGSTNG